MIPLQCEIYNENTIECFENNLLKKSKIDLEEKIKTLENSLSKASRYEWTIYNWITKR